MKTKPTHLTTALLLTLALVGARPVAAHLTYPATREFGVISPATSAPITITGQTTRIFGWADGTDADWASQDNQRYFKLTLASTTTFTLTVTALAASPFFPAFSIYSGLGHAATDSLHPDYDAGAYTVAYLASLGAPAREGPFDGLHTFQIGNDDDPANAYTGGLVTLVYQGNAADGTAANYGPASGINGDGVADGAISGTFTLPAGAYTIAVGGADYFHQTDLTVKGFTAVITVPEPTSALLAAVGTLALVGMRRRRDGRSRAS